MNEFRNKVLGGPVEKAPLLRAKAPRPGERATGSEFSIPREAGRSANHRDSDRHRLASEDALLVHGGEVQTVTLVNLSGGGAMIEGAENLKLWDRIELQLGPCDRLEAVVRWIKGDRIGLEFAHETRIEADAADVADMLRAVIHRSFPDVALSADIAEAAPVRTEPTPTAEPSPVADSADSPAEATQRDVRHPLIWSGWVHYNHESTPVRLRNISRGGALIEGPCAFPVGAELLLDLDEAGTVFSSVHWARGDQAGLRFHQEFDVSALARCKPDVAGPRWVAPDYLRIDRSDSSPWARQWGRADLAHLHRILKGS